MESVDQEKGLKFQFYRRKEINLEFFICWMLTILALGSPDMSHTEQGWQTNKQSYIQHKGQCITLQSLSMAWQVLQSSSSQNSSSLSSKDMQNNILATIALHEVEWCDDHVHTVQSHTASVYKADMVISQLFILEQVIILFCTSVSKSVKW